MLKHGQQVNVSIVAAHVAKGEVFEGYVMQGLEWRFVRFESPDCLRGYAENFNVNSRTRFIVSQAYSLVAN